MNYYELIGFQSELPEPHYGPPETPRLDRVIFFLNFDGTLVDIVDFPDPVSVPADTRSLLNELHARTGGATVILSGRSMRDLVRFFPDFPGPIVGSHGAEQRIDGKLWQHPAKDSPALAGILQMVRSWADSEPGLLVEEKPCSVVQHFNRAPDRMSEALTFMGCVAAHFDGFTLHRAKLKTAAEILPENVSKRRAAEALVQRWPARMPIAFGDDLGDEDVFEAVNRSGGQSIRVGDGETCAMFRLSDPAAVRDTLRGWLERAA
jgi:trehalose 6-phosphate phosphatase